MDTAKPAGPDELDWMTQAACRAADPELFFPISAKGPAAAQVSKAKAICRSCPVRELCLSYALTSGQEEGIWGGLLPDERRTLRRRVGRARVISSVAPVSST